MSQHDFLNPPEIVPESGWYSNDSATFGDRVAAGREALGMSQEDLARKLGVKLKTLQAWEDDLREPRANKLQILAGLLNVSLMWLLNGEGEGLSAPAEPLRAGGEMAGILTEIRELRGHAAQTADRLGVLEKRLRRALAESAA